MKEYKNYINGQFRDAKNNFLSINPTTGAKDELNTSGIDSAGTINVNVLAQKMFIGTWMHQ